MTKFPALLAATQVTGRELATGLSDQCGIERLRGAFDYAAKYGADTACDQILRVHVSPAKLNFPIQVKKLIYYG